MSADASKVDPDQAVQYGAVCMHGKRNVAKVKNCNRKCPQLNLFLWQLKGEIFSMTFKFIFSSIIFYGTYIVNIYMHIKLG